MEKLDSHNYLKLSEIIDATEYERLHGIKEGFINHEKNEDNLYGVYVPREQKAGEK